MEKTGSNGARKAVVRVVVGRTNYKPSRNALTALSAMRSGVQSALKSSAAKRIRVTVMIDGKLVRAVPTVSKGRATVASHP